jgi:hypothetical protein
MHRIAWSGLGRIHDDGDGTGFIGLNVVEFRQGIAA